MKRTHNCDPGSQAGQPTDILITQLLLLLLLSLELLLHTHQGGSNTHHCTLQPGNTHLQAGVCLHCCPQCLTGGTGGLAVLVLD